MVHCSGIVCTYACIHVCVCGGGGGILVVWSTCMHALYTYLFFRVYIPVDLIPPIIFCVIPFTVDAYGPAGLWWYVCIPIPSFVSMPSFVCIEHIHLCTCFVKLDSFTQRWRDICSRSSSAVFTVCKLMQLVANELCHLNCIITLPLNYQVLWSMVGIVHCHGDLFDGHLLCYSLQSEFSFASYWFC